MTIEEINSEIRRVDTNQVSDGFHTFGELYKHRIALWITLCRVIDENERAELDSLAINNYHSSLSVWRSQKHSDGELAFGGGWFVLGVNQEPGRQATYHLPMEYWESCAFAQTLEKAPEWDGHTSDDVLVRLLTFK